jgi:hypothetical protein
MERKPIQGTSSQSPSPSPTNPWSWEVARDSMARTILMLAEISFLLFIIWFGAKIGFLLADLPRRAREEEERQL